MLLLILQSLPLIAMHIRVLFPSFNALTYLFVPVGGEVLVHVPSILMLLLPEFSLGGFVHIGISLGSIKRALTGSIHLLLGSHLDFDESRGRLPGEADPSASLL